MESRIAHDPDVGNQTVAFTIARTSGGPATKTFAATGPGGAPKKTRDAGLSAGTARRVTLDGTPREIIQQLADMLPTLSQQEMLILAPPPPGLRHIRTSPL